MSWGCQTAGHGLMWSWFICTARIICSRWNICRCNVDNSSVWITCVPKIDSMSMSACVHVCMCACILTICSDICAWLRICIVSVCLCLSLFVSLCACVHIVHMCVWVSVCECVATAQHVCILCACVHIVHVAAVLCLCIWAWVHVLSLIHIWRCRRRG